MELGTRAYFALGGFHLLFFILPRFRLVRPALLSS